ncbi:MAG: phosphoribosylformylglycinamidine cyclo-ligase [Armatimonadetes bacterium]|nr:phosphoribosylformylglycinamidine cyclo-ligase [Armatimonadota bacterium]
MSDEALTYASAGVDIEQAEQSLRGVTEAIKQTHGDNVVGGIGSFGAMYNASFGDMARPILVSSIDGVGTKTKIAAMVGDYSGIGHDIVNHCVNDILCQGAKPLFFLDYFGCSRLDAAAFHQVVTGAADACKAVGCSLVGGETAEMPGVYVDGEIDVVGSIVGVVDSARRLPRPKAKAGDKLVGIASNGLHTNGYSLARRAFFEVGGLSVRDPLPDGDGETIGEALLRPHLSYFEAVYPLLQETEAVFAAAHITGGGIYGNLPRVLPSDLNATIYRSNWTPLPVFTAIQVLGQVPDVEMYRTFNMGIGMVLVVDSESVPMVLGHLNTAGVHAAEIGDLQDGTADVQIV